MFRPIDYWVIYNDILFIYVFLIIPIVTLSSQTWEWFLSRGNLVSNYTVFSDLLMFSLSITILLNNTFAIVSSSEDPLKWQFVDQFVSESGVSVFFWQHPILNQLKLYFYLALFLLLRLRRRRLVWLVWLRLEEKKSRKRKFSLVWWAPKAWESGE